MKIEKLINLDLLTQFFNNLKTHLVNNLSNSISIEYSDLVALRDNDELIPGTQYRINDFVTTTTTEKTMSAGHQFDIIVTASSNNTLNEDAKAALHDGDTYFANCNIDSWELKYSLDNDANRFAWADTTNGKGVIYYMKDNGNNECPYDFKNIMFKNPNNPFDTTNWYYTFTNADGGDLSLSVNSCYENKIYGYYDGLQLKLNNIIFNYINGIGLKIHNNVFENNCYENTFGDNCYNNNFAAGCNGNSFENNCYNNTFGDGCYYNYFGDNANNNSFGNGCHDNSFYGDFSNNTFGNNCYNNYFEGFGECSFNNNTFGDNCSDIYFRNTCSNNTFGDNCNNSMFGFDCYYNIFGNNCSDIMFTGNCYSNTFGDNCINIRFLTVSGNSNCYFKNISFENGCEHMKITDDTPVDTTSPVYVQNYIFMNSTSGTSDSIQEYTARRGNTHSTKVAKASDGTLRTYCEEDLADAAGTQVELVDSTNIEYSDYDTLYLVCDRDYSQEYLTIEALEDNFTFSFSNNNIEYKIEGDDTWTSLPAGTTSPTLNAGQRILLKGNCTPGRSGIGQFVSQQKFNVMGNVMSLLFGDDFKDKYDLTGYSFAFSGLFAGKPILNAKNLILPATTLISYCYRWMFNGCTSLTTAPELPATTLESNCYLGMFTGCTSLTAAPELPATTLVSKCYSEMFSGCSNLNYIKAMFTTIPSTSYLNNWVTGVAEKGTFVKNINATWDVIGISGIPEGWNVIEYPFISPAIVNSNDDVTFYYNDGLYTPAKKPISLLSIFEYSQMMQLKPECDIEVCILSEGSLVESSYEWKCDMSLNDVIDDLNLYYEDITIVINKVIIESNDAGYYGYYYY